MGHVRHALRFVGRQPAFSAAVVLMLALGVGGATAMFSIIRAVLLKPLPYERPDELVWMFGTFSQADSAAVSPPDFHRLPGAQHRVQLVGRDGDRTAVGHGRAPERSRAAECGHGERRPDHDARRAADPRTRLPPGRGTRGVCRHHQRSPLARAVPRRTGRARTAAARGRADLHDRRASRPRASPCPFDPFIRLTDPVDLYVPIALDDAEAQVRRFHFLRLIGRLGPGVTLAQAQSQMDVIARQLEAAYPENKTWKLRLLPLHERLVGDLRRVLFVLLGAVLVLLLVACSNVAGLLLARGVLRQPEIALRTALGASRRQLLVHLLAEALVLASLGGIAGLLLGCMAGAGAEGDRAGRCAPVLRDRHRSNRCRLRPAPRRRDEPRVWHRPGTAGHR